MAYQNFIESMCKLIENPNCSSVKEKFTIEFADFVKENIITAFEKINNNKNENLTIELIPDRMNVITPIKANTKDAGYDLYSHQQHIIPAKGTLAIPLGFTIEFPKGCYGQIYNKSGNFAKTNLVINTSIIDYGYTGELFVLARNQGDTSLTIPCNHPIAQLIICKQINVITNVITSTAEEDQRGDNRGSGRFGSTYADKLQYFSQLNSEEGKDETMLIDKHDKDNQQQDGTEKTTNKKEDNQQQDGKRKQDETEETTNKKSNKKTKK